MNEAFVLYLQIFAFFFCLALSAFFSSAEMALFSLSRAKILSFKNSPVASERTIFALMTDYQRTLITIILGNMVVNSCISMLDEEIVAYGKFGPAATLAISAVTGIVILLLFGEITPMTIAYMHSETWSRKAAPVILFFRRLLYPVTGLVGFVCDKVLDFLGRATPDPMSHEEYLSYIDKCVERGAFAEKEAELLKETFRLREKTVSEIMKSRVDLTTLTSDMSHETVADLIRESRQAYMPLGKGDLDTADRLLLSRSFFDLTNDERRNWYGSRVVTQAAFIPESSTLNKALVTMKKLSCSAALVTDEYGGVTGMLTREDIYSELAGNSVELNGKSRFSFAELAPDVWIFDGMSPLEFVREHSLWKDCGEDGEYASNNLNGLFCEVLGGFPKPGDSVRIGRTALKALAMSKNRVTRIRVKLLDEPDVDAPSAENGKEDAE